MSRKGYYYSRQLNAYMKMAPVECSKCHEEISGPCIWHIFWHRAKTPEMDHRHAECSDGTPANRADVAEKKILIVVWDEQGIPADAVMRYPKPPELSPMKTVFEASFANDGAKVIDKTAWSKREQEAIDTNRWKLDYKEKVLLLGKHTDADKYFDKLQEEQTKPATEELPPPSTPYLEVIEKLAKEGKLRRISNGADTEGAGRIQNNEAGK